MLIEKSKFWHWCKQETGNISYLARKLGVGKSFVSNMMHNRRPMPVDKLKQISLITGISVKELRPDLWEVFKDEI